MDPQNTPSGQPPSNNPANDTIDLPGAGTTFKPVAPGLAASGQFGAAVTGTATPTVPSVSEPPSSSFPSAQPSSSEAPAGAPVNPVPVSTPKPGRGKKGLLLGVIVGVVVILACGAAAAYYMVANSPENVLKQALANSFDKTKTQTMQFSGSMQIEEIETSTDIKANFAGTADNGSGAFDIQTEIDVLVTKLTLDARSTDGKTFYVKAGGLAGLSQLLMAATDPVTAMDGRVLAQYAPLLDSINNQWIEINESFIKQLVGESPELKLSDADRQKIVKAYQQYPFLVVKQKLADQMVKGVKSHHMKVGVDKPMLKSFLTALKDAKLDSLKMVTDADFKQATKQLDEARLDDTAVDVWIAKSTKMINQIGFTYTADGDTVTFRLTMDGYNKPVKVEKPAGAKTLLEVISNLVGGGNPATSSMDPAYKLPSGISL